MRKLTVMIVLAMLVATPVLADICDDCGITDDNVDLWRAIDPSGNGYLSTYDLVLFTKFFQNCNGGFPMIFEEDLDEYINSECDVDGDGVWEPSDQLIIEALKDFFILTGLTQVTYEDLIACLRAVILAVCP